MGEQAEGTIARLMRAYDVHDENALAIQMGRDMSTIRVWKSRDAVPLLVLTDAAKATGYSLAWLRGEEGAAERETPRTPDDDATRVALSPRELQLIERYRSTDEDGRSTVEMLTVALVADPKKARQGRVTRKGATPTEEGVSFSVEAREGPAPWKVAKPVRPDRPRVGDGVADASTVLLPISSASKSRPLVLTLRGRTGETKGYEVIPKFMGVIGLNGCDVPGGPELDQAGDMVFGTAWLQENFGHTSGQLASVRVHGDSMTPTLQSGDSIVIDTAVRRVDVSGIYVIEAHGDRMVKRVNRRLDGTLDIISDNAAYPPESVPVSRLAEVKVIGRMVGRWQR